MKYDTYFVNLIIPGHFGAKDNVRPKSDALSTLAIA